MQCRVWIVAVRLSGGRCGSSIHGRGWSCDMCWRPRSSPHRWRRAYRRKEGSRTAAYRGLRHHWPHAGRHWRCAPKVRPAEAATRLRAITGGNARGRAVTPQIAVAATGTATNGPGVPATARITPAALAGVRVRRRHTRRPPISRSDVGTGTARPAHVWSLRSSEGNVCWAPGLNKLSDVKERLCCRNTRDWHALCKAVTSRCW